MLSKKEIVSVVKPQQIDVLSKVGGTVSEILDEHNEKINKEGIIKKFSLKSCLFSLKWAHFTSTDNPA